MMNEINIHILTYTESKKRNQYTHLLVLYLATPPSSHPW